VANKPENKPTKKKNSEELQILEDGLKTINPKVFNGIPDDKKEEILKSFSSIYITQEKMHSGPLPDPETLIKYNSIIPNGADRIMKEVEGQSGHRRSIELKVINSQSIQSKLGQIFGLIIGLVGIGCGTYLAAIGKTTVGGIIAGATVVSLVSVFVIGKKEQHKKTNKTIKQNQSTPISDPLPNFFIIYIFTVH